MTAPGSNFTRLEQEVDRLLVLSPTDRALALAELGATDAGFAEQVRQWLADIERSSGFLEGTARHPGQLIGAWSLERPIGRGGMGEVWLAERADGRYRQRAAIKFLLRDRPELARRLVQESHLLARLNHPGIARLLDAGDDAVAGPYFVTEWIDGVAIDQWIDTTVPTLTRRIEAFLTIAGAVGHAHRALIVHRDIKPANILIDATGHPFLLDFGIAKWLDDAGASIGTVDSAATPNHAAPEQLLGEPIGTWTDIHALGALLYRMLCDRDPLGLTGLPIAEVVRRTINDVPTPPSAHNPERVDADLDAICLKALEKRPADRYPTVEHLIGDLTAWRDGGSVSARRGGRLYHARKFVGRHRKLVAAASVLLLSIVAGLAATLWQANHAARQAQRADATREFLVDLFSTIDPERNQGKPVLAEELVAVGEQRLRDTPSVEPELRYELLSLLARMRLDLRQFEARLGNLDEACATANTAFGIGDTRTLVCEIERADALRQVGRADDADTLLTRIRAELDAQPGDRSAQQSLAREVQFMVARDLDQPARAETLIREAITLARRAEPEGGNQTAHVLEQYAVFLNTAGRLDETEPLLREIIDFDRANPDQRSATERINTQWNLLTYLWARERFQEVIERSSALSDLTEQELGRNHAAWFRERQVLANATARLGDFRRAMAIRSDIDATEGIDALESGRFRQMVWADQILDLAAIGDTRGAMAMADRVFALTDSRQLPPAPAFIAAYGGVYAAILHDDAEAARQWSERMQHRFDALPSTAQQAHRKFLLQAQAAVASHGGDTDLAASLIDDAIRLSQPEGKPTTFATERMRTQRAFLWLGMERHEEAARELQQLRDAVRNRFDASHPAVAQIEAIRGRLPASYRPDLDDNGITRAVESFRNATGRDPDTVRLW